MTSRQVFN